MDSTSYWKKKMSAHQKNAASKTPAPGTALLAAVQAICGHEWIFYPGNEGPEIFCRLCLWKKPIKKGAEISPGAP